MFLLVLLTFKVDLSEAEDVTFDHTGIVNKNKRGFFI